MLPRCPRAFSWICWKFSPKKHLRPVAPSNWGAGIRAVGGSPARFELPAAALPFDVTVPTMVLAPRAAAWTAKERAEGCAPEAGREPEGELARGAGRDHAGARGSRGKRRPESARQDPGAKAAEEGRAERTAKPKGGWTFLSPTSSRAAASYCACVALAAARSR